jgi:DNA topoisomerase-1
LFGYIDDERNVQDIGSADINEYLREVTGQDFAAKSFRTWAATVLTACALQEFPEYKPNARAKRNVNQAIEAVAGVLGNTPSICRKSYIHPAIIDAYTDGWLPRARRSRRLKAVSSAGDFQRMETAVLAWLHRLQRAAQQRSA